MKIAKKSISVLLVFAISSAFMLPCFAEDDTLSFFAATDLHVTPSARYGTIEGEHRTDIPMFEHVSPQGQMNAESEAITNALLSDFKASDEDIMLLSGDLSWGDLNAHKALAAKFASFEDKTGKKIFVINGNHDIVVADGEPVPDGKTDMTLFKEVYADFGYNEALATHPTSCSYTADLSNGYRLIAIDSCVHGENNGSFSNDVLNWVEGQARVAAADGVKLIAMMHHSLLPHFSVQPMTDNYEDAALRLAEAGIEYAFTGHMHANDISVSETDSGKRIYDIMTDALLSYPNAYRIAEFSGDELTLTAQYITQIDISDLPSGFTEEQLNFMENDFSGFAHGYFEAGMSLWLDEYIGSPRKVAPALNIEKGTAAYDALAEIMALIGDSLALPVYDDGTTPEKLDSIEEIAAGMGYELPQTEYEQTYKLVATIMGGFFAGDREFSADDPEIELLYSILKGVISNALGTILADGIMPDGLSQLLTEVGTPLPAGTDLSGHFVSETSKLLFMRTAGNFAVASIIGPLLEGGIIKDYCEPADLDVTLGTELPSVIAPITLMARIAMIIEDIMRFVLTHLDTIGMYC